MTKQLGGAIVDVGNVIIAYWDSGINSANYDLYPFETIPEVPGVFDSLRKLNEKFGGNISLVYKASNDATEKTLKWLGDHKLTERTGISFEKVFRTKDSRDKTPFMSQSSRNHYGTTVVIDDRLEVMSHFVGKASDLFLFRPQLIELESFRHTGALPMTKRVSWWHEIDESLKL